MLVTFVEGKASHLTYEADATSFSFFWSLGNRNAFCLCYPNFCDHEFISVSFQLRSNYLASANVKYPLTLLNPRTNKMFLFYFTF